MGERYLNRGTDFHELTEGINGAEFVTCPALAMGEIYENATHKFFGEAVPGAVLGDPVWRVSRLTIIGKRLEWADGNGNFDNVFTNLSIVENLSYS